MTKIRWLGRPIVRRLSPYPYVWCPETNWVQDVDPGLVLELLTNEGFELAEEDDLALTGMGPAHVEALVMVGIATYQALTAAPVDRLQEVLGADREQVKTWRRKAAALMRQKKEMAPERKSG